jgi:hypothetical protein
MLRELRDFLPLPGLRRRHHGRRQGRLFRAEKNQEAPGENLGFVFFDS